ncbi:hypothetical protein ACN38_g12177 [Penicillium nordicum]|uniref:Uncharacterized protein n=1 Tax=Penicillium nordicum TaxID=229535 RepID=A0A0M8NR62_9EURO|nr:hypothetical protein ACN38_g12177 [Penicillium nordicum]
MAFMAIMSTLSSQVIPVSSIVAFDGYIFALLDPHLPPADSGSPTPSFIIIYPTVSPLIYRLSYLWATV